MNKNELISAIAENAGTTKKDAERVLKATLETITAQLIAGEKVQLPGFGAFETRIRQARTGRNPHTKETFEIPEARIPAFKPSKTLKDKIV